MATIMVKGVPTQTIGELPAVGRRAPAFTLTATDLSDRSLREFAGKTVVLNIFPSIDTPVCAASTRRFNEELNRLPDTVVLCISADLPYAFKRFCEAEGLTNVISLSVFRAPAFGNDYGVLIITGPRSGLLARAVVIIDPAGNVIYTELVPEITQDPDFESALKKLPT